MDKVEQGHVLSGRFLSNYVFYLYKEVDPNMPLIAYRYIHIGNDRNTDTMILIKSSKKGPLKNLGVNKCMKWDPEMMILVSSECCNKRNGLV